MFESSFSKCHLSRNELKKVPSFILSRIFTAIPPATYMSNLLASAGAVAHTGQLFLPAADGRVAMEEQLEQFFFGEGAKLPEGYVAPKAKS